MKGQPQDGCEPLSPNPLPTEDCPDFATVVYRGGCSFDTKAYNAQTIGSRLLIIIDHEDSPLQRIGGQEPLIGTIGG
jgi:hypothetical protein